MNDIFDESAKRYSEEIDETLGKYGANHNFFTEHKAKLIQSLLQARGLDSSSLRLLDVGCGVAKIHEHMKSSFSSISGIDISTESLKVAQQSHPDLDYREYDGKTLPYEDSSFDVVIAIAVFHHIPPDLWPLVAGQMLRILRPGGLVIVIEHNPLNPVTRSIVSTCPLDKDAVLLWPNKLRSLFVDAGASEVETRTVLSVPPVRKWLGLVDNILGRLPFGAQYYMTGIRPDYPADKQTH